MAIKNVITFRLNDKTACHTRPAGRTEVHSFGVTAKGGSLKCAAPELGHSVRLRILCLWRQRQLVMGQHAQCSVYTSML